MIKKQPRLANMTSDFHGPHCHSKNVWLFQYSCACALNFNCILAPLAKINKANNKHQNSLDENYVNLFIIFSHYYSFKTLVLLHINFENVYFMLNLL